MRQKHQLGLMVASFSLRSRRFLVCTVVCVLYLCAVGEVLAQGPAGQSSRSEDERQSQVQNQTQDNSFIHGVSAAIGLAIYQGDYSRNPEHNIVKYVAGNGNLAARLGLDHRMGRFEQYGLGVDLLYNRLAGKNPNGTGFEANSIALDFYGDYELPYIKQGLLRVFVGGGPNLILSPSYDGIPAVDVDESFEENVQPRDTRVIASFKVGITILDSFRIGTRVASTDLLDGYKGFDSNGVPDFVSFINVGYRFDV